MIKLIKNELIKIFKRKNIYIILILAILVIAIYNQINPNQNSEIPDYNNDKNAITILEGKISKVEREGNTYNKYYAELKTQLDYMKIHSKYEKNSWQRIALNKENERKYDYQAYSGNNAIAVSAGEDVFDYNELMQLKTYIYYINLYELGIENSLNSRQYEEAKEQYSSYIKMLDNNEWENLLDFQLKYLEILTEKIKDPNKIKNIEIKIEEQKLRVDNKINYQNNVVNDYINKYTKEYYNLEYIKSKNNSENEKEVANYEAKLAYIKYAAKNNIKYGISESYANKIDARNSLMGFLDNFSILIATITIYIAGTILTEELHNGTIKTLLNMPHKRKDIVISKILASALVVIIVSIILMISQFIIGGFRFGFDSYKMPVIKYNYCSSSIETISMIKYLSIVFISKLPIYIMIIIVSMLIGIISNNSAITITLSSAIYIFCKIIISGISSNIRNLLVTQLLITNNWDFSIYMYGGMSSINGLNIQYSLIVYTVYVVIFLWSCIHLFKRKEI